MIEFMIQYELVLCPRNTVGSEVDSSLGMKWVAAMLVAKKARRDMKANSEIEDRAGTL